MPWTTMFRAALTGIAVAATAAAGPASAQALDKVTFGTNWVAEAEHGGFYQALADGTYRKYGLDVTIRARRPEREQPHPACRSARSTSFSAPTICKVSTPLRKTYRRSKSRLFFRRTRKC